METSWIVLAGIVVCGLCALPLSLKGLHKLAKDFFRYQEHKEEAAHNKKIEASKDDLKKITENGTLSQLIDAAKQLGDEKKKKEI